MPLLIWGTGVATLSRSSGGELGCGSHGAEDFWEAQ